MISMVRFERLYGYKGIYSNVYIVYMDNEKIVYIRNSRFYKGNVFNKREKEEAFSEVVFDEEGEEKLTFGKVQMRFMFSSGEILVL